MCLNQPPCFPFNFLRIAGQARLFFIIRGIESYPVLLGDLLLPASARLRLHRFSDLTQPLEMVTLMRAPKGTAGALFSVRFDANSSAYGYLEACMRAVIDPPADIRSGSKNDSLVYLSSGAEVSQPVQCQSLASSEPVCITTCCHCANA